MKLLYEQYKLVERDSRQVGGIWKALQIITFAISAVFGLACLILLYSIMFVFNVDCILYPKIIYFKNDTSNRVVDDIGDVRLNIDDFKSQFSDFDACYFPIFNPILCVIFSIVWISLFTMCPHGGSTVSGLKRPWRIVVPSFLFCFSYSIMCLVVSSNFQTGMNVFLEKLNYATSTQFISEPDLKILNNVHIQSTISILCSWLYSTSWILAFLILALRCVLGADFHYVHVKVELLELPGSESDQLREQVPTINSSLLPTPEFSDAQSMPVLSIDEVPKKQDLEVSN